MAASTKPKLVLLALEKQPWFEEMYAGLLPMLNAKADVEEITDAAAASTLLNGSARPVVFATDGALTVPKFSRQQAEAVQFVRTGGTLIFGAHFPSFTSPPNIKKLFTTLGLPWEAGDYHRTEFDVNAAMTQITTTDLVPRYSQKALHLAKVKRGDAVYLPSSSSRVQSMVFAPTAIEDLTQTPAAFTNVGEGKVGYMGDVNGEQETNHVILAMCGLAA